MGTDGRTVRIAVAGAGNLGDKCLEALTGLAQVEIVGVCDAAAGRAEQAAATYGGQAFVDHRQLLQQLKPDILVATTPPSAGAELVHLAAKAGSAVVKAPPLARTLDEATELVGLMNAAKLPFAVLAPRRYFDSYRQLLASGDRLGRLFLARSAYVLNWERHLGWRADQATAGGGVLLEAGYQMLDLMVLAMGLPEEVYAITGKAGRPHMIEANGEVEAQGLYDTDDTAVAALRYADGAAGNLYTSWVTHPSDEHLTLHGQQGTGMAGGDYCTFRDTDGRVVERNEADDRPTAALTRQLEDLARSIATGADRCDNSAAEHLLTMAVVEAAYLSDRTGQPENPRQLLWARGFDAEHCKPKPAEDED